jgi:hypothetical protein
MRKTIMAAGLAAASLAAVGLTACASGTPKPAPTVTRTVAPSTTAPPAPAVIMTASQLDTSVMSAGDWTSSDGTVSYKPASAQCEPLSVSATGAGNYQCVVDTKADKSTDGYTVIGTKSNFSREIIVGADGSWVSGSTSS